MKQSGSAVSLMRANSLDNREENEYVSHHVADIDREPAHATMCRELTVTRDNENAVIENTSEYGPAYAADSMKTPCVRAMI